MGREKEIYCQKTVERVVKLTARMNRKGKQTQREGERERMRTFTDERQLK